MIGRFFGFTRNLADQAVDAVRIVFGVSANDLQVRSAERVHFADQLTDTEAEQEVHEPNSSVNPTPLGFTERPDPTSPLMGSGHQSPAAGSQRGDRPAAVSDSPDEAPAAGHPQDSAHPSTRAVAAESPEPAPHQASSGHPGLTRVIRDVLDEHIFMDYGRCSCSSTVFSGDDDWTDWRDHITPLITEAVEGELITQALADGDLARAADLYRAPTK